MKDRDKSLSENRKRIFGKNKVNFEFTDTDITVQKFHHPQLIGGNVSIQLARLGQRFVNNEFVHQGQFSMLIDSKTKTIEDEDEEKCDYIDLT